MSKTVTSSPRATTVSRPSDIVTGSGVEKALMKKAMINVPAMRGQADAIPSNFLTKSFITID